MKTYTQKQLEDLVKEYPGNSAEAKRFIKWCKNYTPRPKTLEESDALVKEAVRQWVDICLMQIKYNRMQNEKSDKQKIKPTGKNSLS